MSDRAARLAALALIAVAASAACVAARNERHTSSLPPPAGGWRTAIATVVAGSTGPDACGVPFGSVAGLRSAGLPCGVKLYVRVGGRTVLTEVVDHARPARGSAFDVSLPLARLLGLAGRREVEWSYVG